MGELPGYTFSRRPVALVYSEAFTTREEALACERRIKGWSRQKKEAMMRGDWAEVSRLAKGGRPFDKLRTNGLISQQERQGPVLYQSRPGACEDVVGSDLVLCIVRADSTLDVLSKKRTG